MSRANYLQRAEVSYNGDTFFSFMNIAKQMNFVRPSCLAEGGDLVVKTDDTPLLGGWFSSFQKGVPKNKIKKYFKDYLYNQLVVDSSSCTLVSTFTALSNKYDVEVPYEVMREALEAMRRDGKFTNGVGAYLKDGVDYALDAFNRKFNKSIVARPFALDGVQLWYALGVSPVVTGFRYAEGFFADEQDNGKIDRDTRRII